ncbi:hypothetical protein [Clostridium cylindrosporum]|uniref:Uncharacterized protein n=1 Tax=Clostridium cylindrosporum DSM 605 TaxID=1121307 RepID=A0A0J8D8Y0_CLOCY|nr:hypothetical protein [Clostridium cylindrosporum]KMT22332.1 hypothetical protein CLCY_16c00110 [Clostridium cylindrosporum DSM 605]
MDKELQRDITLEKIRQDLAGAILDIGEIKYYIKSLNKDLEEIKQSQEVFQKLVMEQIEKINPNVKDIKRSIYRVERATAENWSDIADLKQKVD